MGVARKAGNMNRRGSSRRADGLLGQEGDERKGEKQMENMRAAEEKAAAGRGWMSTVGLMSVPAPRSSLGRSEKAARGLEDMAAGRKREDDWETVLPPDLWERTGKRSSFGHVVLQ